MQRLKEFLQDGGNVDQKWGSMSIPQRQDYINKFLQGKGYSPIHSAAIVGNLTQENSTLTARNTNPKSQALGLAQWLGRRKTHLLQNANPHSIDTQLNFLAKELEGTPDSWTNKNAGGRKAFLNAKTVEDAVKIFRLDFERPGEAESNDSRRIQYAHSVLGSKPGTYQGSGDYQATGPQQSYIGQQDYAFDNFMKLNGKIDYNTLPSQVQKDFIENQRLEQQKLVQESEKEKVENINKQLQYAIEQKKAERDQMLANVPKAQFVESTASGNDYVQLLNNSQQQQQQMQDGGMVRHDGTQKGQGFYGPIKSNNGTDISELAVGMEWDGQEHEVPTMVPGLTPEQMRYMTDNSDLPEKGSDMYNQIVDNAGRYSELRQKQGQPLFAGPEEEGGLKWIDTNNLK